MLDFLVKEGRLDSLATLAMKVKSVWLERPVCPVFQAYLVLTGLGVKGEKPANQERPA